MGILRAWDFDWLWHGFSTRLGGVSNVYGRSGDLNLGWTKEDADVSVSENRRRFAFTVTQEPGVAPILTRQTHGVVINRVHSGLLPLETAEGRAVLEGDGLITNEPGMLIGVQTADCIPVILADPVNRAVGVFHAGWRGTVAGIVEAGVQRMHTEFGSQPAEMLAAIGPGIGPCCFEVGNEVRDTFRDSWPYAEVLFHGRNVDLWQANQRQLIDSGLHAENITVLRECTAHQTDRFFSYRAEKGVTGRMISAAGIRPR
ncbi:peptidoglycan editing factor PgeF [Terriglobus albidus]|uniref:peptidoglycan editing factor PgeF n=1 Tax=Terriglobus albidus TaxID=1592106 RepID=UPI0021DFD72F|nr:peptidoglycan editing factor PgeF [Terriglobus albidus]